MRKDYDKKKKRMVYIAAFIIVAVMVLSSFGMILEQSSNSDAKRRYNGYSFVRTENGWLTTVNKKQIEFYHAPDELDAINISQSVRDALSGKIQIGLTSDEGDHLNRTIALMEYIYTETLKEASNKYATTGFIGNNTYGKPVFSCEQATDNAPVIYFMKSKEPSIKAEGNCVIVTAETDYEMVVMSERLLYYMIGIMKE